MIVAAAAAVTVLLLCVSHRAPNKAPNVPQWWCSPLLVSRRCLCVCVFVRWPKAKDSRPNTDIAFNCSPCLWSCCSCLPFTLFGSLSPGLIDVAEMTPSRFTELQTNEVVVLVVVKVFQAGKQLFSSLDFWQLLSLSADCAHCLTTALDYSKWSADNNRPPVVAVVVVVLSSCFPFTSGWPVCTPLDHCDQLQQQQRWWLNLIDDLCGEELELSFSFCLDKKAFLSAERGLPQSTVFDVCVYVVGDKVAIISWLTELSMIDN